MKGNISCTINPSCAACRESRDGVWMADELEDLLKIYDDMRRGRGGHTYLDLLSSARQAGVTLTMDEVRVFSRSLETTGGPLCPDWVVSFLALYCKKNNYLRILDIWAGIGSLIGPLLHRLPEAEATAFCVTHEEFRIAPVLNPWSGIEWREGDAASLLAAQKTTFDVVMGWLPGVGADGDPDSGSLRALLLTSCDHLNPGGAAIFVVSEEFFGEGGVASFARDLSRRGVHLDSALSVMEFTMLIVRREIAGEVFVGALLPDQGSRDILQKNIELRREGKAPYLGILLEKAEFRSVQEVILQREIAWRADDAGLQPVKIGAIAAEIHFFSHPPEGGSAGNAVYLPLDPELPAMPPFRGELIGGYVQIVLDPDRADARYVARSLNTPLGDLVRELWRRNAAYEDPLSALHRTDLYLPPLDIQREVVAADSTLDEVTARIDALRRDLWDHPMGVAHIRHATRQVCGENGLEDWIETLPFPLASILWDYRAEAESGHKVDHLFNFFEALSEFHALIMLSALAPLCIERGVDLLEDNPYFRDSYRYATFRAWNVLGRRLARHTRTLLSDGKTRAACLTRFGNPDPDFIRMLTSKTLFAVLDEVADYRNVWKAHGGVAGEVEEQSRLSRLEGCLKRVHRIVGESYETVLLLAPGRGEYHEGTFSYQAAALAGSRPGFRTVGVETDVPMDTEKLYLIHALSRTPLELLPLIRMMENPCVSMDVCYFYNRIEGEEVRWVSYYVEGGAERTTHDPEILAMLASLHLINLPGER